LFEPLEFGVNLVGYFRSETGVGQSARSACAALRAASVPVSLRNAEETSSCRTLDTSVGPMSSEFPYSTNLMHVNADQTSKVMRSLGEQFRRNRHNIGYWAWELEQFPDRWNSAFTAYQEIWTPSSFCRDAFARKATVPVFTVPHAISPIVSSGMDRQHFGLQPHSFIFLYAFDVLSVMERKNPLAAIRAFEKAFGGNPNCQLVIKVNNTTSAPKSFVKSLEALRLACGPANIRILDATFSRGEMYALTQCADCIVSLHRSEGFGLFIAEAMYFGKPVIVTNYSGNTDFTRADNSMLVDYRLIPVGRGCHPYDAHCLWADPDVEQAASHMKIIASNADLRLRLSSAGSEFVKTNLSPAAVGQIMRHRLESFCKIEARQIAAAKDAECGSAA
jgi:glycosyltransferase involved in cell wall biosynthesis